MDNERIANELIRMAKALVARDSIIDSIISQRDVAKLDSVVDEQTYDLAVQVYRELDKALRLSPGQQEALNRLKMSTTSRYSTDMHRNNIFKAAHALGIKLPSMSF